MAKIIIVMGVSGSGKTTIGKSLSDVLNIPFYDADSFHSQSNIEKMRDGLPLNDKDREPWLNNLATKLKLWSSSNGAVLACSALKEMYREQLSKGLEKGLEGVIWIYLDGSYELIKQRMEDRSLHFFKPEMLKSQFDALEAPKYGIHVNIDNSMQDIITYILKKINHNA